MRSLVLSFLLVLTTGEAFGFAPIGSTSDALISLPNRRHAITTSSQSALGMASTTQGESLTIYGHPGTRSPLVNWACYELGLDKVAAGDLSQNPHPFGQMPCLTDDNNNDEESSVVLFESGAILIYLVINYSPQSVTKAQKASIISWITWANASLDPICFLETPEGKVYDTGLRDGNNKRVAKLDTLLQQQGGVLVPQAGFSVADVAVASYLLYVVQFFPQVTDTIQSKWPTVAQYMKAAASRPDYARAFGADLQRILVGQLDPDEGAKNKKLFGIF